MKRVRRIYFIRRLLSPAAFKMYGTGALAAVLSSLVSVPHVFANMPSVLHPKDLFGFVYYSALRTELAVQFVLFGIALFFVLIVRDMVRMARGKEYHFA